MSTFNTPKGYDLAMSQIEKQERDIEELEKRWESMPVEEKVEFLYWHDDLRKFLIGLLLDELDQNKEFARKITDDAYRMRKDLVLRTLSEDEER